MKASLYYFFFILLIFSSCLKDDDNKIVSAGIYDSDYIYHEFSPPLKVDLKLDTIKDDYFWNDSIDINQDGINELFISQRIHIPAESGSPTFDHFPYLRLITKSDLQIARKIDYYAVGHGQVNEIDWVDTLNYKTQINDNNDWTEGNDILSIWLVPPLGAPGTLPYGTWFNLTNEEKYVGIRMKIGKRYKYGWIKLNVISRDDIQFICYAIEK